MNRRQLLLSGSALLLIPRAALAGRKDRPPKIAIELTAAVMHRRKPVNRDDVELRFAIFNSSTSRDPIWSEVHKNVEIDKGAMSLVLGRRGSLGTVVDNDFPEKLYLQVQALSMGPDVNDLKLAPLVRLDWKGTGTAPCLELADGLGDDDELDSAECMIAGEGAVTMAITRLQRVPVEGAWTPPAD